MPKKCSAQFVDLRWNLGQPSGHVILLRQSLHLAAPYRLGNKVPALAFLIIYQFKNGLVLNVVTI